MDTFTSSKRRFVAYVEPLHTSNGYRYLKVKVPVAMATAVERDALERQQHGMRYYADAFADGLAHALTSTETQTLG
jgi:hypothetical protein